MLRGAGKRLPGSRAGLISRGAGPERGARRRLWRSVAGLVSPIHVVWNPQFTARFFVHCCLEPLAMLDFVCFLNQ